MHSHIAGSVANLLAHQFRARLPINPFTLQHNKKRIIVKSMGDYFAKTPVNKRDFSDNVVLADGLTVKTQRAGKPLFVVLYNEEVKSKARQAFTIGHELGHIYLEHEQDGPEEEKEADVFAAELLVPRSLVWWLSTQYGEVPHELIQNVFGVSQSMAKKRLDRGYSEPQMGTGESRLLKRYKPLLPNPDTFCIVTD